MFGFHMNFGEQFETFDCVIEVNVNGEVQRSGMSAPRIIIEQQFMSLVQQAAQANAPVIVTLSRNVPVYNEFDGNWIERESSITFSNSYYNYED